ncbi:hypothetical protein E2C01_087628 [Portunus trituberculatus]|uniref:Uncharacterized protein n=1 Tax=Portunus trituberculatus TaxID=210409 RepID=A0A5B7JD02_PORTR|nr:hypothetical protein [Portunus trituberculatus]
MRKKRISKYGPKTRHILCEEAPTVLRYGKYAGDRILPLTTTGCTTTTTNTKLVNAPVTANHFLRHLSTPAEYQQAFIGF